MPISRMTRAPSTPIRRTTTGIRSWASALRLNTGVRPGSRGATRPRLSHALALLRQVVDEEVLAEPVRPRVEGAALVDARHPLDERAQARAVVEHEGVDGDAAAGDALELPERLLCSPHADASAGERLRS